MSLRRTDRGTNSTEEVLRSTLTAIAAALSELLNRDSRARFNENLQDLLTSIESTTHTVAQYGDSTFIARLTAQVRKLRGMVNRARGLLVVSSAAEVRQPSHLKSKLPYQLDYIEPGSRHDSDKRNISDVVISPTKDDILCEATDFLPFTDLDQPHFLADPFLRHIDTQFRSLRHDQFGTLKDALAPLLRAVALDSSSKSKPTFKIGDVRAYQYTKAYISAVRSDKKGGLRAELSFDHPVQIETKSVADKTKWWSESRRLQPGSFLSFFWAQDAKVQHLFLSTENDHSLSVNSGPETARITTQLVTIDRENLTVLMQAAQNYCKGILLEFARVMPASFVPVLRNLQDIQSLGSMPFMDWIVSGSRSHVAEQGQHHQIPPPAYARDPNFRFPLKSISKKESSTMFLNPKTSHNDNEV